MRNVKCGLEYGLCVFINNGGIIYASPIANYKILKIFYKKVMNYLNESTYF